MKPFARTRLFVLLAVLLAALTACGGSGSTYAAGASSSVAAMPQTMDMAVAESEVGFSSSSSNGETAPSSRKIVRRISLSLETKEFDDAIAGILDLVSSAGGYVENQRVSGVSLRNQEGYRSRNAEISARIPTDRLDEVTGAVGELCNVVSQSESADDITDHYYDTEAHLSTLRLQEERLLAILEKAEKLEDVITLEQALSETRYEIEALTASINRMDSQVAYSYLNIDLSEVVDYNVVEGPPKTFGEKVSASWGRSVRKMGNALEGILFFVIEDLPVTLLILAFWGGIAFLVWKLVLKRIVSHQKNRRVQAPPVAPPPAYQQPAPPSYAPPKQPESTDQQQPK